MPRSCSRRAPAPPPSRRRRPPPQVTVAEVIDRDVTEWDEFTGRLEAVDTVSVRPRVSGYVESLHFNEGAIVGRGQLLFQIDPRPFQTEVDRLRAELNRAKATVQRAQSELQRAERLQAENAMSHEEHDRRASFAQESAGAGRRRRSRHCVRRNSISSSRTSRRPSRGASAAPS